MKILKNIISYHDPRYLNPESKLNIIGPDSGCETKFAAKILSDESLKKQELSKPSKPHVTFQWQEDSEMINEDNLQQNEVQDFLRKSKAKQIFRILIKDPISNNILEDYWQLTSDQANNFVDENSTAYCIVTYD
jgi:hypothetical protein